MIRCTPDLQPSRSRPLGARLALLAAAMLALAALLLALGSHGAPAGGASAVPTNAQIKRSYAKLPLAYEPAPASSAADYVAHAGGYSAFLTPNAAATLAIDGSSHSALALRLGLAGANPGAPQALAKLPGTVNYIEGKNPSGWRTNLPTYAGVRYPHAWKGIAVTYRGRQRAFDYDFDLGPGADPQNIALRFSGQSHLALARSGDLILTGAGRRVRERAPVAFQTIAGHRQAVRSAYVLHKDGTVGIALGRYQHSRALTIDPVVLGYSSYLGGTGADQGYGIAVDASGDAYVTGATSSTDFPATTGAYQTANVGSTDVFITKLNPAGSALVYSTYLGGSGGDVGHGVTIDSAGNAYIVGLTNSTDFPTTSGALQTSYAGNVDAFVAKLKPSGSGLSYSTYLGGSQGDRGLGIAVDSTGHTYISGETSSTDLPTTSGAQQASYGGGFEDAFVSKLNPAGSKLDYSTYLGGSGDDRGLGIALDSSGDAYVTGLTESTDFPTTTGAYQTSYGGGGEDAFVSKLKPSGSTFAYSTYLGGSDSDSGEGIAVDASGAAYLTGETDSSDFPTTSGAYQTSYGGGNSNAFVTKISPGGSALTYSTYLGGSVSENGSGMSGIAVDSTGDAYVTGFTGSTDFPTTSGAEQTALGGPGGNAFVTMLNAAGSGLGYSTYLGGSSSGGDAGYAIALDSTGDAYVTGLTESTDFPTTSGAYQTSSGGGSNDAFLTELTGFPGSSGTPDTTITSGPADGTTTSDSTPTYAFSSSVSGATFSCAIDGGAFKTCSSPDTLTKLAEGDHTFAVRAVKGAATDPTPATRTLTVQTKVLGAKVKAKKRQKQKSSAKKVKLALTAKAGEKVKIKAAGKLTIKAKKTGHHKAKAKKKIVKLKTKKTKAKAHKKKKISLKPKKKSASKEIISALKDHEKVSAKLKVKLTDSLRNHYKKTLKVKLALKPAHHRRG